MILKIIILNTILFCTLNVIGQVNDSTPSKEWHLEAGYQNFRTYDKNVSPLIYVSNNGALGFRFQKKKQNKLWDIAANVSVGSNQSKSFGRREAVVYDHTSIHGLKDSSLYVINPGLSFIQASLSYAYYWQLSNKKSKEVYLGGQLQNNFYYGAMGADIWFFNQLSLMPAYRTTIFNGSKSLIEAKLSVPILSYLLRQPYTLDPSLPVNSYFAAYLKTGSAIATLNKFQQINLKLDYRYKLNKRNKIGLSYHFMWMNYANIPDRNLKAYSNSLFVSYVF